MTTKKKSSEAETINVLKSDRPLFGFTPSEDGYRRSKLGVMTRREFEGENTSRLYFKPSTASTAVIDHDAREHYSVGHISEQFKVIDHAEVLQPLVALGYTITKIYYARGGLNMLATLEPQHPIVIDDPLIWDHGSWQAAGQTGDGTIRESLFVKASMRPGIAIHINRGWFRKICINGLVAEILSLGAAKFSHSSWSSNSFGVMAKRWPALPSGEDTRGPLVGTVKGVKRMASVLESLNQVRSSEELFDEDDDDRADPSRAMVRRQIVNRLSDSLPMFVRDEIMTFTATPGWLLVAFIQQLKLFADESRTKEFFALDLVNSYTNAVNKGISESKGDGGFSTFRQLSRMEGSVTSAMKLVGGFSM